MDIYLMRHGETPWNKEGRIQGSSDIPLSPYGIELAEDTRDGLVRDGIHFDRIYSSPLIRAVQTAEVVNEQQHAPLILDPRIREMCFGKYEGKYLKEVRKSDPNLQYCFFQPELYQADESGESFEHLHLRVWEFLEGELKPLENDPQVHTVLVVCHGAVIRAFLAVIRQMDLKDFWSVRQPNCCVTHLQLMDGKFSVQKENILYYTSEELMNRGLL